MKIFSTGMGRSDWLVLGSAVNYIHFVVLKG